MPFSSNSSKTEDVEAKYDVALSCKSTFSQVVLFLLHLRVLAVSNRFAIIALALF